MIGLDLHPSTGPISSLAPTELARNHRLIKRNARRHAFKDTGQRWPMRFAGREKTQSTREHRQADSSPPTSVYGTRFKQQIAATPQSVVGTGYDTQVLYPGFGDRRPVAGLLAKFADGGGCVGGEADELVQGQAALAVCVHQQAALEDPDLGCAVGLDVAAQQIAEPGVLMGAAREQEAVVDEVIRLGGRVGEQDFMLVELQPQVVVVNHAALLVFAAWGLG